MYFRIANYSRIPEENSTDSAVARDKREREYIFYYFRGSN